jgi:hypothetical protein
MRTPKIANSSSCSALFLEQSNGLGMGVEYGVLESMANAVVFTSVHFMRMLEYNHWIA